MDIITVNHKFNFIDDDFNLVSEEWFDDVRYIKQWNFAMVLIDKTWYVYNFHTKQTVKSFAFYDVSYYSIGDRPICVACRDKEKGYLLINMKTGKPIARQWFKDVSFELTNINIIRCIRKDGKEIIFNKYGELLVPLYCDYIDMVKDNTFILKKDGLYNLYVDKKFLFDEWIDYISIRGFVYKVVKNGHCNLIKRKGNCFISNEWFDEIIVYAGEYFIVKKNDKYNVMNGEGQLLSHTWFNKVEKPTLLDCDAIVIENGKYNILKNGNILMPNEWFDEIKETLSNRVVRVKLSNGKWRFLDICDGYISDVLFDECKSFQNGIGCGIVDGVPCFVNKGEKVLKCTEFKKSERQ